MLFASIFLLHSVLGLLDSVIVDVSYPDDTAIKVDPALYEEHHGERFHKTMNDEPIEFKFTVTNTAEKDSITIDTRETPLAPRVRCNPFPEAGHVLYLGVIAESAGMPADDELMTLAPGETITVTAPFEALAFAEGSDPNVVFQFDLVDAKTGEEKLVEASTHVPLTVALKELEKPDDYEEAVGSFSADIKTGSDGIPYVDPQCVDNPQNTGYTWSGGAPITCADLNSRFNKCANDASVQTHCPVTCGRCGDIGKDYSKPNVAKSPTLTFNSNCEDSKLKLSGMEKTDKEWLLQAEQQKQDMCASILWHITTRSGTFESMYVKWFGGNAKSNDPRMVRLRDGFVKICSIQNYAYNCNPSSNCEFSATLQSGQQIPQNSQQISWRNSRQTILDSFRSIGGTGAWVSSNPASSNPARQINVCPIIFYLSKDAADVTSDLKSRVGTVFHELSHFTDMGDTNDMSYNSATALDAAKNYPAKGDYTNNAATWDDFAEDISQFVKNWVDFSSNSGSGGGGSGGSTPTSTTTSTTSTTTTTTTTTTTNTPTNQPTTTTTRATTTSSSGCRSSQWQCADKSQCITGSYLCDGSRANGNANWGPDCRDGSDEDMQQCCAANPSYSSRCSGTSTPTKLPTTATTTTSAATGGCSNNWSDGMCNSLKDSGYCTSSWMQSGCCKACSGSASVERAEEVDSVLTYEAKNVFVGFFAIIGAFSILATIVKFALHKYHSGSYVEIGEDQEMPVMY
jgi:hypothetical protein